MMPVYAYIRVSTTKQGEKGSSLREQRHAIERYAEQHRLKIVEWFEEQETAAKRGRTNFMLMLDRLLKGQALGVIIHKIDRGARNLRDWADLGSLIDRGIQVYFAHESLDMQSRGGRLAADIQAVVAADYIRNLRDEVKKGFYGRLRQGIYPLPAPIGYIDQGAGKPKLPDPIMGPLVQKAFRLYATGNYTLCTLGKEVCRLGLRNKGGGRVTRTGLSTMLNSEFYIGIIHIRKTDERFPGKHEPIIKKSEFDQVRDVLLGRTRNTGRKNKFRYSKSLQCAHCNYSLIAERQKGQIYYRCHTAKCPPTSLREDVIDEEIRREIAQVSMTSLEIEALAAEFQYLERNDEVDRENLRTSLELRIKNIAERLGRLADAYIDQKLDKEVIDAKNQQLLHEKASLREALEELAQKDRQKTTRQEDFLELLKRLALSTKHKNRQDRYEALKRATSNLQIDQKSLVVCWLNPFQEIVNRPKSANGAPCWTQPRTFDESKPSLAQKLWKYFHDERADSWESLD